MAPRQKTARYGIAEWFGKDITTLTPEERQSLAQLAVTQDETGSTSQSPHCPYLSTLIPSSPCNKASGVCSLRRFAKDVAGTVFAVPGEKAVTVCPNRFIEPVADGKTLFSWIAEHMLDISEATIIKETPFLRRISAAPRDPDIAADMEEEAAEEGKKAGRIDWILVDPATMDAPELAWCAVETQALYFSGNRMRLEFDAYAAAPSPLLFPVGQRRPDYRSSGPKRLWPQLDVKVPSLGKWGKKLVVVIDRFFYENMNTLADAYPRARDDRERRDNSDVVWFIVDYDEQLRLRASSVIYATLEGSRNALNATEPLSKGDFTRNLRAVIRSGLRTNKVFKASK